MQLSLVDILFLVTVVLLVFNGLRNGAVFSLVHLVSIPVGAAVAYFYGPRFTLLLADNGLPATPLISYIVLFLGTVLVLHILGTLLRSVVKHIPLLGVGDALLGGAIGIVEAWLVWLILLGILGSFLAHEQQAAQQNSSASGVNVPVSQVQQWRDFYNTTVTHSLFAKANGFFVKTLPDIPQAHH
jgi:uncharacterized membrane protein required for colicin V production